MGSQQKKEINSVPKNIILYGPPGTGKTYVTKEFAVRLANGESPQAIYGSLGASETYKEEFKKLREEGRIEFITFHQNYSYEDFIQGLRPDVEAGQLLFKMKDGIFKTLCEVARTPQTTTANLIDASNFYKMSLGEAYKDADIYNYCMDEGVVALGWGGDIDYAESKNRQEIEGIFNKKYPNDFKANIQFVNKFKQMRRGDIVLVSKGNKYIRAIGKIDGDYEYNDETPIPYKHFRKITWLYRDALIPVQAISQKKLSQQTIYSLNKKNLKLPEIQSYLSPDGQAPEKNYVIIIDEINRANISRVFGELITLIEEDKRGEEVQLPSGDDFSIPPNLFIIGTMNTADKSIALIDIALRRRFTFLKMYPRYNVPNLKEEQFLRKINGFYRLLCGYTSSPPQ